MDVDVDLDFFKFYFFVITGFLVLVLSCFFRIFIEDLGSILCF